MAEQQLVDYIKKAKEAGQADEKTRDLLYKNGWLQAEVDEAFSSLQPQVQPAMQSPEQIQPQVQEPMQIKSQVQTQPEIKIQTQPVQQPINQPIISKPIENIVSQSTIRKPQKKGLKVAFVSFILLFALAILGGVGYFVVTNYFIEENPESVVAEMLENMQKIDAVRSISKLELSVKNTETNLLQSKFAIDSSAQTDTIDEKNPKIALNLSVNATDNTSGNPVQSSASLNLIGNNNSVYLNLSNLTVPSETLNQFGLNKLNENIGKWFKINENSIKVISQDSGGIMNFNVNDLSFKNLNTTQDLRELSKFFIFDKKLEPEVVSGQKMHHYLFVIDKNKLKSLFAILGESADPFLDKIGVINVEIWIGSKDKLLHQYKVNKSLNLSQIAGLPTSIDFVMQGTNSEFNKTLTIQLPENSQLLEEVVVPYIKEQKIINDLKQISFYANSLMQNSENYYYFCNKGLLNGYLKDFGDELVNLHKNLEINTGNKPVCYSGYQNYCVSVMMPDGSYLCTGKNNIIGQINCIDAASECK